MSEPGTAWPLYSEHSGTLIRLRRLVEHRRAFVLCFLTYSDSAYRDTAAGFLSELLGARLRVVIDRDVRIGTEEFFQRLCDRAYQGPALLSGLELWPDGLDDLLKRLNYRREALATRCQRPLLVWIRTRDVCEVATVAADLWAWRSGVFDFALPPATGRADLKQNRTIRSLTYTADPQERLDQLQRHLRTRSSFDLADVGLLIELGDLRRSLGQPADADRSYSRALTALSGTDDRRRLAIVHGRIADTLEMRGELEEALRIRKEEEIPVYERLGDMRSLAMAKGAISDILQMHGELDEALRIRTEDEIPVYERLGDDRSVAITKGQIADILQARGQLDEALRIRSEVQLPVFQRLRDVRSVAVTQGRIADILLARGELDEALRILTEEQLPAFERLGDMRSLAIGDVRSLAITNGQIADILEARGNLDEALRIRMEKEIPIYERLGDGQSLASARLKIEQLRQQPPELGARPQHSRSRSTAWCSTSRRLPRDTE